MSIPSMNMQHDKDKKSSKLEAAITVGVGEVINASGHKQELERQFSLLPICAVGITTGNVWAALGGSIVGCYKLPCSFVFWTIRNFSNLRFYLY